MQEPLPSPATYGVVIPNWNGAAFIERCLGSALAALRAAGLPGDVLVYDDASQDGSPALVAEHFPGVRLIASAVNAGFGAAVNRAMQAATADWIFLLNNDLALPPDFCTRLIETQRAHRGAPLLAIGARTLDWATQAINHGGQRAVWRGGLLTQEPFECDAPAPADFFQAGACLIDRRRFLELGGFAALYAPAYWEDYDLSWQARRHGWAILYDPGAVAYHGGKGSMTRKFGRWGVTLLLRRNHLLFNWVNLEGAGPLARHLLGLAGLVARDRAGEGEAGWGRALLAALSRLPVALAERRRRQG